MYHCTICGTRMPRRALFCPCCGTCLTDQPRQDRAHGFSSEERREPNLKRRLSRHILEVDFRARFTFCLMPLLFSLLFALAACDRPGIPALLLGLGLAPGFWIAYRIYRLVREVLFGAVGVILGILGGLAGAAAVLDGISRLPYALPTVIPILSIVLWYGWYLFSLIHHLWRIQRLYSSRA